MTAKPNRKPLALPPRTEWMDDASCATTDGDAFFPTEANAAGPALRICRGCPVVTACLDYAVTHRMSGVWGGTTDRQRTALTRGAPQRRPELKGCGTTAGYTRHIRHRTPICDPCRKADRIRRQKYRNPA